MDNHDDFKNEYNQRVTDNYHFNFPVGIFQGLFFYAGLGFYNYSSIFASFVYDLSGSEVVVGFMATVMGIGYTIAQLYGPSSIEHLKLKKPVMLKFGLLYRIPWLLMGISLTVFPVSIALPIVIILYGSLNFFNGLYLLTFFDFMSKIIPVSFRGTYFGLRNSLSMGFQAGAGYLAGVLVGRFSYLRGVAYVSPIGYAICFILAFIVHMIDWIALSKLREEPALVPGIQRSVRDTIINYPKLLRGDKNFSRYCIMRALISLGFYTSAFIIVFAKNRISVTGEMLGIFTAVNLVSIALGNFVGGQMANRIGFKRLLETAAFCVAAIYFTTSLLGSFSAFLIFFIVNGFMTGWIFISFDNLIMEFGRPDNRPSYIAISSMISGVSGILGPMTAGLIASRFSFVALFYGIGIIVMLTSVIMHFTVTDPRHIKDYWV